MLLQVKLCRWLQQPGSHVSTAGCRGDGGQHSAVETSGRDPDGGDGAAAGRAVPPEWRSQPGALKQDTDASCSAGSNARMSSITYPRHDEQMRMISTFSAFINRVDSRIERRTCQNGKMNSWHAQH